MGAALCVPITGSLGTSPFINASTLTKFGFIIISLEKFMEHGNFTISSIHIFALSIKYSAYFAID